MRPNGSPSFLNQEVIGQTLSVAWLCRLRCLYASRCWQLKNRGLLAWLQKRQQHDLTIRKFQRVVMVHRIVFVDLPEDHGRVLNTLLVHGHNLKRLTSFANANSAPGKRQTAICLSSDAANPREPVPKLRVISFSPTLAGRVLTF